MSERAIGKMVKELEKRTEGHCEAWGAVLSLARRLALEEAKEKPTAPKEATAELVEEMKLPWKRGNTGSDQFMFLNADDDYCGGVTIRQFQGRGSWDELRRTACGEFILKAVNAYHPCPQADIVGELKAFAKHKVCQQLPYERGFYAAQVKVEEIIAKHEGDK